MAKENTKITFCPNCQQPAIRKGSEITCESCDAVFTVTKKDGPRVKEVGPIDDHEKRLQAVEEKVFGDEPDQPENPDSTNDEVQDESDGENW
ncbi:MAG: hypothetical protein FVQ80_15215 [Planctomycetes bacterium]|nr:hypothetical protein [Planctomycetota bacterium]